MAAMYVCGFLAVAAFCTPCSAFAPQGALRSNQVGAPALQSSEHSSIAELEVPTGAPGIVAAAATAILALGAAGLAMGSVRSRQQRPISTALQAWDLKSKHAWGVTEVGVVLPLKQKFDPLNLGNTDEKMERHTAVEIKHGRIAMIAVVGYVMPDVFRFPGCEGFGSGLSALSTIPTEGLLQLFGFVAAHELLIKPRQGGMGSYDIGLGTELLEGIPANELERRQTVERSNGRLAMVAIMGLMFQDGFFGKSPIALMKTDGWWGPGADFLVKDIPICQASLMGGSMCALKTTSKGPGLTAMRSIEDGFCMRQYGKEVKMSPACPFMEYPYQLEGWVGGEKGFDPLGVTDALPVYFTREAELKHGRVCMLATLGWIATDLGARFPGEVFQKVESPLTAHDRMSDAGIMLPFASIIGAYELYGMWLFLQGYEGKINRDAGDFYFGKSFLPNDPAQAEAMRMKELENGRLAMLAFSGIVTVAAAFPDKHFPYV